MRFCKYEGVLRNTWSKRTFLKGIVWVCALMMVLTGCGSTDQGKKSGNDEVVTDIPVEEAMHKESEAQIAEKQSTENQEDSVRTAYPEKIRSETSRIKEVQAEILQPEKAQSEKVQSERVQPAEIQSEKTQVETAKPKEAQLATIQTQNDEGDKVQPEIIRLENDKDDEASLEVDYGEESRKKVNSAVSEEVKQQVAEMPRQEEPAQDQTKQPEAEENVPDTVKADSHACTWDEGTVKTKPGCAEKGVKTYKCSQCGAEKEEELQPLGHQMTTQWYGEAPDCTHGGYQAVLCSVCGWVDEAACKSVPPLEHTPVAQEIQHGNCREDTIIVYACSYCKEQTGYERYPESEEHSWVMKETQVWDEEVFDFVTVSVECCERCNAVP